ncbi:glycan biosynthesis hexose transferase WsfD [Kineococcus sp. SYSU DK005]|uniref:glycan biosynthesis hexose transferase WsfD n=1 Tax=Kineococcus sp. SYSU DK005 TaxID=3383126 RepID=UPI003D7CD2A0
MSAGPFDAAGPLRRVAPDRAGGSAGGSAGGARRAPVRHAATALVLRFLRGRPLGRAAEFVVLALVTGGAFALRMLAGGGVGLADDGRGHQLLCRLGLRQDLPFNTPAADRWRPLWVPHTWYGEACAAGDPGSAGEWRHSTQLLLTSAAEALTPALTGQQGLDLRVLAGLSAVLVGLLVAGLSVLVPGSLFRRAVVAGLLLLVLADGAFAGYFASAHPEPAYFAGLVGTVVAVTVLFRAPAVTWRHLLLLVVAAAFTALATPRSTFVAFAAAPLLLVRPYGAGTLLRGAVLRRVPGALAALVLCAGTGWFLSSVPERATLEDDYSAVFAEVLPHSPDPAADLRALGLPEVWTASAGVPLSDAATPLTQYDPQRFSELAGLPQRVGLYLDDPQRLRELADRGLSTLAVLRVPGLASYPVSSGEPAQAQECRVCVLQTAWQRLFGLEPHLFVAVFLVCSAVCAAVAWTLREDRRVGALGAAGVFLSAVVLVQFTVAVLTGGGADVARHLVTAGFALALLVVTTVASVLAYRHDGLG